MKFTLLAFSFFYSYFVYAHSDGVVWNVSVRNLKQDRHYFIEKGYEIVAVDYPSNIIQVIPKMVNSRESDELKRRGFMRISEENLFVGAVDPQYLDVSETEIILQRLVREYPALTKLHTIGKTTDGLEIHGIEITNFTNTFGKPRVVFNGAHHAREVMSVEVPVDIMENLLSNYGRDSEITNAIDNLDIFVIPQFNQDGRNLVFNGKNMWRKNAWLDSRNQITGVDLNRNYSFNFNKCNGSSGSPNTDSFRGPSASSEPETKGIQHFYNEIRPLSSISYHSYSELVIYPYGCANEKPEALDRPIMENLGKELAELYVRDDGGKGYQAGYGWDILYSTDGDDLDFLYGVIGSMSYVIELNSTRQGFQPNYAQWRNSTVERSRPAWKHLLNKSIAGPGLHLDIKSAYQPSEIKVEIMEQKFQFKEPTRRPDNNYQYFKFLPKGVYTVKVSSPSQSKTFTLSIENTWAKNTVEI